MKALLLIRILATACVLVACGTSAAQPRFGLSEENGAVVERWLDATCVGDEARSLTTTLRAQPALLAPAFRQALIEGPTNAQIDAVRSAAERNYARRAKFALNDFRIAGANQDALARFRSVPAQAFIDDQVARYVRGYRANAVAALGIARDAESLTLLSRMARNAGDPLAEVARAALQPR